MYVKCPSRENKKRGRPALPPQIKELRKEQHKDYMREYQRQQRVVYTEEQREEINRISRQYSESLNKMGNTSNLLEGSRQNA